MYVTLLFADVLSATRSRSHGRELFVRLMNNDQQNINMIDIYLTRILLDVTQNTAQYLPQGVTPLTSLIYRLFGLL